MGMYTPPLKAAFMKDTKRISTSTQGASRAFHKLDAPHLVLVTILSCALVVSCYCRKTSDLAFSRGESVRSAGRISTSTQDVSRDFYKLDAPHLVLVAALSFALVVSR